MHCKKQQLTKLFRRHGSTGYLDQVCLDTLVYNLSANSVCVCVRVYSIEADVVVIASCIPTLHPLLELLTGKRTLASSKSRSQNYYNRYYGDASQGQNRSRSRKNTTTLTTMDMEHQGAFHDGPTINDDSSQENIIRRTDDVHIEYEMQVQEPPPLKTLPQETKGRGFP